MKLFKRSPPYLPISGANPQFVLMCQAKGLMCYLGDLTAVLTESLRVGSCTVDAYHSNPTTCVETVLFKMEHSREVRVINVLLQREWAVMPVKIHQARVITFAAIHCEESRDLNSFSVLVPTLSH